MPVIFRANGLRFVIFTDDHAPPHVHGLGHGEVRIGIEGDCPVLTNKGLSRADVVKARNAVKGLQSELLKAWEEIHGGTD